MTLKSISYLLPKLRNQLTKSADFWLSKSIFYVKNYPKLSIFFFIEEYHFRGTFFVIDIFENSIFKALYLLKLGPFFVSWFPSFGKRYGNDLRFISYQWPKLCIGLNVEADIQILKGIYYWNSRGLLLKVVDIKYTLHFAYILAQLRAEVYLLWNEESWVIFVTFQVCCVKTFANLTKFKFTFWFDNLIICKLSVRKSTLYSAPFSVCST